MASGDHTSLSENTNHFSWWVVVRGNEKVSAHLSLSLSLSLSILRIPSGTKEDLRDDPATLDKLKEQHSPPVTEEEGKELGKSLGAALYLECSALTQKGLKHVFQEACRIAMKPSKSAKKSKCLLV